MSSQQREGMGREMPPVGGEAGTRPDMVSEAEKRERIEGPVTWEEMRALLRREPAVHERTWRPTTGGLLAIISGAWNLVIGLGAVFGGTFLSDFIADFNTTLSDALQGVGVGAGSALIVLGIIAIVGGTYAIMRRMWGMALAGSIAAAFPSPVVLPTLMGILSIIFNTLGHMEFKGTNLPRT